MDIDEDDDFYAPEEPNVPVTSANHPAPHLQAEGPQQEDLEEGEEEDEGGEMDEDDDSDIDIITERKEGANAAPPPPSQSRYSEIRNIPQRTTSSDSAVKPTTAAKKENVKQPAAPSGSDLPVVSTSKLDVDAIPVHKGTGKPITQVDIDEDLPDGDKPWRKPGTDLSDYFNYGFDEFTWSLYAAKQESLRSQYNQDAVAQNNKKMMEDINNMLMMGGMMPGMPGATASGPAAGTSGGASAGPGMPGMDGIPPEMQQMMQQMMASGMDPSQMDASAMSAMFASMQGGAGAVGSGGVGGAQGGGQGPNFAGAGFGGNQAQNFGYDSQAGMGAGAGRGSFGGGRGRRGGRNW